MQPSPAPSSERPDGNPTDGQPPAPDLGRLYVIAAPSGAGKTSLVKALMQCEPRMRFSVSYTTRQPRPNEVDGRDYHFVNQARFQEMVDRNEFLEHARVFDNFYGTGLRAVQSALQDGQLVLLEIDWQGARQVRARLPAARSIFILPPTRPALEERLRARSTDSDAVIQRRLEDAADDLAHWSEFDYVVVNDQFEQALADLLAIVRERGGAFAATRPEVAHFASRLLGSGG
jgi:guanylate kinase